MDEAHKKEIETKLVYIIIQSLEQGHIKESETPVIADFILQRIDLIANHEQLLDFLRELSSHWQIFSNILVIESGEVQSANDVKTAEQALQLVKEGKVAEAVDMVKEANAQNIQTASQESPMSQAQNVTLPYTQKEQAIEQTQVNPITN